MEIAIDFDGTCVTHEFPAIGKDIGAVPVLKRLVEEGHKLIIYTMRSGDTLNDAINWYFDNDIPYYAVQQNPSQHEWTTSPKCYAQLYIDDAALGCPLVNKMVAGWRPYVDWNTVEGILENMGILDIKIKEENKTNEEE
jgi:hypothetical protein